jgi:ribosomal protein S18 acetylase RimI-like enzyme
MVSGVIREGRRDDLNLLANIELEAGQLFPASRIPQPDVTYPLSALEQSVNEELLFVVEVERQVVGFAACSRSGDRLHLDEVSVHPEHGRRGYGRALVERVIDEARKRGLTGVSLTTFADIPWNGPFYASMGFSAVPEAALDETLLDALTHERNLGMTERVAMIRSTEGNG